MTLPILTPTPTPIKRPTDPSDESGSMLPLVAVLFALLVVTASGLVGVSNAVVARAQSQIAADASALAGAADGRLAAERLAAANDAVLTAFDQQDAYAYQRRVEVKVEARGVVAVAAAERVVGG